MREKIWKGFYVLEGIDGSGKTTCMELLKGRAAREGAGNVAFTSEPTDRGRAMLALMARDGGPHPDTACHVYAADRSGHLYGKGGVREALDAGLAVFCDRYLFSSIVYQGLLGDPVLPEEINKRFPLPEAVLWLDIGADEAMERIARRGKPRPAAESAEFLREARELYGSLFFNWEEAGTAMRIVRVDASRPPEEVADIAWRETLGRR